MKRGLIFICILIVMAVGFSGCYIYSNEPLPRPAVIIVPAGQPPPPVQKQTEPPPAPVGPPAGEVGAPKS